MLIDCVQLLSLAGKVKYFPSDQNIYQRFITYLISDLRWRKYEDKRNRVSVCSTDEKRMKKNKKSAVTQLCTFDIFKQFSLI